MYNAPQSDEDRLLCQFGRLLKLAFNKNPLEESGITLPQLTLIDWIAVNPGTNLRAIAEGLALTSPTVSVAVRRLEQNGLLQREPDPEDGRAVQFSLTESGCMLYKQALTFRQEKMRLLLGGLSRKEITTLVTLLDKAISSAGEGRCDELISGV